MSVELWRAFDDNPVTHSVAHHLMAIEELRTRRGYARVSDVARQLGITRGSVSLTLKGLKQRGLVEEDDNRFISLSTQGREIVRALRAKRSVLQRFLGVVLGVPAEAAAADSCKIEHLVSDETAARMLHFLHLFGSPAASAVAFRQLRDQHQDECPGSLQLCPACDKACLLQILEHEPDQDPGETPQ